MAATPSNQEIPGEPAVGDQAQAAEKLIRPGCGSGRSRCALSHAAGANDLLNLASMGSRG